MPFWESLYQQGMRTCWPTYLKEHWIKIKIIMWICSICFRPDFQSKINSSLILTLTLRSQGYTEEKRYVLCMNRPSEILGGQKNMTATYPLLVQVSQLTSLLTNIWKGAWHVITTLSVFSGNKHTSQEEKKYIIHPLWNCISHKKLQGQIVSI